jgi:hypothetical protein
MEWGLLDDYAKWFKIGASTRTSQRGTEQVMFPGDLQMKETSHRACQAITGKIRGALPGKFGRRLRISISQAKRAG